MEFKFRAIDDRTLPCQSSHSPSLSYFSEQALRVNYTRDPNFMHNRRDFYAIQREIEKERIRHEIIMAELENVHRRLLVEEVRREMARPSQMSLSIDERLSMQLPASCRLMHPFNNHWLEDRFAFPGNCGMGFGHDTIPLTLPHSSDAVKDEIRSALEVNKKDKLIMLAKPDPNLCGTKRKATTPPAGSGELPLMSSKKPKEWSCALCQVSASNERGLNEHLQGKKHKAREAGLLRAQRMRNNSTSSSSKKSGKQIKLTESRDSAGREIKTKLEEESVEANKTVVGLDQKMEALEDSENKNVLLTLMSSKKPKEWSCALCQVSASSDRGLNEHLQGKKHKAKEAGLLRAQWMRNNSTSSSSKKSGKQIKLTESRDSAGREIKTKVEEESVEANKTVVGLDQKMEAVEDSENKNELPKKKDLIAKTQKKKNGILTTEKMKKKLPNRKKLKFWCEDCQVGTHSAVVMEGHKRGKKHLARCSESKPNGEGVPATTSVTIVAQSEPTEKTEDEDVEAEEANEETTEIVTEKPEDKEVVAEDASEETTENVTEKAEDEDVVAKEENKETAENVVGDSDSAGSSIVADVVDPKQQTP